MPQRLDFKQLAQDIDITDVSRLLGVKLSKDMRAECCGSERSLQIFAETNSFTCWHSKVSGDCISLYAHAKNYQGMYRAARELEEHFRTTGSAVASTAPTAARAEPTAPKKNHIPDTRKMVPFDAAAFAAKLTYSEEVKALGVSEEDAERFGIGHYRGKTYFAVRHDNGEVAGFIAAAELKIPPSWLPKSNVFKLKRA